MADGLTDTLAEFISTFSAAALPAEVLRQTALLVHDGTGALVAAANPRYSTGRLIAAFARDYGGAGPASVVGHGFATSPVMAALANGTMGYACDVEPHHPEAILHPVAVMTPTALAIGEMIGVSGEELLAAVALGLEVEYRVSVALGPAEQYALGFHPSAVCGTFGAAAAAAFLLGLSVDQVRAALGLAGCQASGTMAWESDPTENSRPFQMGMAARNGVTAALLARSGFGGPTHIFDGLHTPFRAFSRNPQPDRLLSGLGVCWDGVMEMAIKPYSCVSFLHPGLDALLALVREHDLKPDAIERITIRFPQDGIHCIDDNPLKSHCAQYILPVAVVNRELRIADIFIDRRIDAPSVAALCRKVHVTSDPELDQLFPQFYATIIEVETVSGQRLRSRNDIARGYPETPLSEQELAEKFNALAGSVMPAERVRALDTALRDLPEARSIAELSRLLREPVGEQA